MIWENPKAVEAAGPKAAAAKKAAGLPGAGAGAGPKAAGPARRAVDAMDKLHAELPEFRVLMERSLAAVREAAGIGWIGVSFSGGKDSLVSLHLVRSVVPDAPAALFDSGCEMAETLELARHYGVEIITPRMTFPEMARYSGWWGYRPAVDLDCPFNVRLVIIDEPAEAFVVKHGLRVQALGLRAEESKGRAMNAASRGMLYQKKDRTWNLCPVAFWSADDIWAYIAAHDLSYHPCYDAMSRLGIARRDQRLGASLGAINLQAGRLAMLRRIAPGHFAALASEFPGLRDAA